MTDQDNRRPSMQMNRLTTILGIAVGCIFTMPMAATAESMPKRAVFEGTTDSEFSDFGVWVSELDGSEPKQIAGDDAEEPALSPDGLEVAFTRDEPKIGGKTCIEVMSVEGEPAESVYCGNPRGVTWSPNGYQLAFSDETETSESYAIYVLNLRTNKVFQVADWFYRQDSPTFSPDGTEIAFESLYTPEEELAKGIWVVSSTGTGLHQLTDDWEEEPSWSPDGSQIAVAAYNEEEINEDEGGIALIDSTTGEYEKWLLDDNGPFEYDPEWTTDGKALSFTRYLEEGIFESEPETFTVGEINADGTEEFTFYPGEFFWSENFKSQKAAGGLAYDPEYLLTRYEPVLHYDSQEQYFADSAAEATDGPENRILSSNKEEILAAHEEPYPTPSLSLLGESEFAGGWIDEGPEYAEDAAAMHAKPEYGNRAYGRVHQDPETKAWWLQYWFWYYYNSQSIVKGEHEGDWEHVSFRLDDEGIPDLAVYSRHKGVDAGACEAYAVQWEISDRDTISPVVYVANASHANYFRAGEYDRFPLPTDDANGNGPIVTPEVSEVEDDEAGSETALPHWFYWSGTWGNSSGTGNSPESPAREGDEWGDVQAFADGAEGECEGGGGFGLRQSNGGEPKLPQPVAPKVSAHVAKGGKISVRYKVATKGPAAEFILLSVTAKDQLDATRTRTVRIGEDHGVVLLPRPFAAGPYLAAGSTYSARGERSEVQVVDVAHGANAKR